MLMGGHGGQLDGGEGEQTDVHEETGKEDFVPGQGNFVSKGVRQGIVPRRRRVGKTAKAERGGPSGPAESLDLLL